MEEGRPWSSSDSMWISPAYSREYQEWIDAGTFEEIRSEIREGIVEHLAEGDPRLVWMELEFLANCCGLAREGHRQALPPRGSAR